MFSRAPLLVSMLLAACGSPSAHPDARPHVDAGPDAQGSFCNVTQQVGCNPGERCAYLHVGTGLGEPSCVPSPGTVPLGGACTFVDNGADDCTAGAVCAEGVCRQACAGGDCLTGFCPRLGQVCLAGCEPLAGTCPVDQACYLSDFADEGPGCAAAGTVPLGAACQTANDCVPGATCSHGLSGVCVAICDVSKGSIDCPESTHCGLRTIGDRFGVCVP